MDQSELVKNSMEVVGGYFNRRLGEVFAGTARSRAFQRIQRAAPFICSASPSPAQAP